LAQTVFFGLLGLIDFLITRHRNICKTVVTIKIYLPIRNFGKYSRKCYVEILIILKVVPLFLPYCFLTFQALGERYKVDEKNFPAIFLFKGNAEEYIQLPSHKDVTVNNLKAFINSNTHYYIGRDGCIKEFNEALKNYANIPDEEQLKLIEKLQAKQEQLTNSEDQQNGKSYLIYMRKIHEVGYGFLEEETKRLLRLKASKVSEGKKEELLKKLNILEAFRVPRVTKAENEKQEL